MKKTKVIIPALGMLLLSTAASVTGTVAWFSMNNNVTAKGMNIKAKAENGIVIAATADSATWSDDATATHNAAINVYPTSTIDATTWCHSNSNSATVATSSGGYSMLTISNDSENGAGYVDSNGDGHYSDAAQAGTKYTSEEITAAQEGDPAYGKTTDDWKIKPTTEAEAAYYLKNSFFVKSSADAMTKAFYVNSISVTGNTGAANFDKCLRVLIKQGSTAKIFAPLTGADTTYNVCTAFTDVDHKTMEAATVVAPGTKNTEMFSSLAIPAYSGNALEFEVYLYFEGEDENCTSANLIALDTLAVTIVFGTAQIA